MNKITKIIIGLLCLWAVTSTVLWLLEQSKREKAENKAATNQQFVNQAATIINRYIDTGSRKHVVISSDENKLNQDWYKNGTAISSGLIDTVTAALKIARKQIEEVTQISSITQAEKLKAMRRFDSLQRVTYYYKDKYLQLAYRPASNADTTDHGQFDFKYNDSLNVVQYRKRKNFLSAKKSYIDIFSNDPRTTVNGVKRLIVQQNEPNFGLRLQAVSSYSFPMKMLNIGPGVQVDFNRFSLVGTYSYNFNDNNWGPSIGARYDLIRFN